MSPEKLAFAAGVAGAALIDVASPMVAHSSIGRAASRWSDSLVGSPFAPNGLGLRHDLAAAVGVFPAILMVGGLTPAVVGCTGLAGVLRCVRRARRQRAQAALEQSMPAAVRSLADALAAGVPLEAAAAQVGRGGSPAGAGLARFAAARAVGGSMEDAFAALSAGDLTGCWHETIAAVALNRRCGGDLPAALHAVADSLEMVLSVRRDARSATAQARATAVLVCLLPAVGGTALLAILPGGVTRVFGSPVATMLVGVAAVIQVGCLLLIRRLAMVQP